MNGDSKQNERLAVVETKMEGFEKLVAHFAEKLSKIVDKFEEMIDRHEEKLTAIHKLELDNCKRDREKIHARIDKLKPFSLMAEYPKLTFIVVAAIVIVSLSKGFDLILKFLV